MCYIVTLASLVFTVYLSLDVGDPGEGEHQRHGVAEAAGVERDPDVARHQQVVLMWQKDTCSDLPKGRVVPCYVVHAWCCTVV